MFNRVLPVFMALSLLVDIETIPGLYAVITTPVLAGAIKQPREIVSPLPSVTHSFFSLVLSNRLISEAAAGVFAGCWAAGDLAG